MISWALNNLTSTNLVSFGLSLINIENGWINSELPKQGSLFLYVNGIFKLSFNLLGHQLCHGVKLG